MKYSTGPSYSRRDIHICGGNFLVFLRHTNHVFIQLPKKNSLCSLFFQVFSWNERDWEEGGGDREGKA